MMVAKHTVSLNFHKVLSNLHLLFLSFSFLKIPSSLSTSQRPILIFSTRPSLPLNLASLPPERTTTATSPPARHTHRRVTTRSLPPSDKSASTAQQCLEAQSVNSVLKLGLMLALGSCLFSCWF
ncbi:hypothetical protein E2542_SST28618 [Spatholobus suberectus]|nr:hypothetical protein E2542_SST28618 [Spatholobus suberectus]